MSIGRLMLSVRDQLRLKQELEDSECQVMPGPEPAPSCGQRFVSVYAHSWNASPDDFNVSEGLVEWYGVSCAVTFRSAHVPFDRLGEELFIKKFIGIEDFCRQIIANVHLNQDILLRTNELIEDELGQTTATGMVEQLRWASTDASPATMSGDWFGAGDMDSAGLLMEVRFEQATRIQSGPRHPGVPLV